MKIKQTFLLDVRLTTTEFIRHVTTVINAIAPVVVAFTESVLTSVLVVATACRKDR